MTRVRSVVLPLGIAVIVLGLGLIHARLATPSYHFGGSRLAWSFTYVSALAIAAYSLGLPDVPERARQIVAASVGAAAVGALVISLAQLFLGAALLPRFVVFTAMPATALWAGRCSVTTRRLRHRAQTKDQILIVGSGEDVTEVPAALRNGPERPAEVVAIVSPDDARRRDGAAAPLIHISNSSGATVVVLDRAAQSDQSIVDQVALLHENGVRVRTLSLFYENWLGRLPVGELERISLMFDIGEIHRARFARRKRLFDAGAAVLALPVLVAAIPLVWMGNLFANKGPLFFRQERVGKGGETFEMLKFRTMGSSASGAGSWTEDDDDRVTRFGRFLRHSHLDELPQVINILRGELSMVGPRPEQVLYVTELRSKLPFYDLRHLVQPGLTGWAQINQGYAGSTTDSLEKLQYEFWYLRHQRLAVDLRILLRTLRSVVGRDGR